jgi:hypothetical protein
MRPASQDSRAKKPRHHSQSQDSCSASESDSSTDAICSSPPPLIVCAALRSHFALACLQLVSWQGTACVPVPSSALCRATVADMALLHKERLRSIGSGYVAKITRSLCCIMLNSGKAQYDPRACSLVVHRVASMAAAAAVVTIAQKAQELLVSNRRARAMELLNHAVIFGHLPSVSLLAWMLVHSRAQSRDRDVQRGYDLAARGRGMGCSHCEGDAESTASWPCVMFCI